MQNKAVKSKSNKTRSLVWEYDKFTLFMAVGMSLQQAK